MTSQVGEGGKKARVGAGLAEMRSIDRRQRGWHTAADASSAHCAVNTLARVLQLLQ